MHCTFRDAKAFDQPLEWDTSNVISIVSMFEGAKAFNQPLVWDEQVTSTRSRRFNQALGWDTSR